jgi:hypothetical protein
VLELVDVGGDGSARAAAVRVVEPVRCAEPLDVGAEDPVFADALIGDDETPRLGLLQQCDGGEMVARGLVDEALPSRLTRMPCSLWKSVSAGKSSSSANTTSEGRRWP